MDDWTIYSGKQGYLSVGELRSRWLDKPPPWRRRVAQTIERKGVREDRTWEPRGERYVPSGAGEINRVNVALLLRRPILVTGRPGVGKSTLAYNIAWALRLGKPLRWEINSQTTLQDGLYKYDAIGHLRAAQANQSGPAGQRSQRPLDLADFIRLGPLGTALLPTATPRVLLVDELDKSGFDLPNDLLNVFEEGSFDIPELVRGTASPAVRAWDAQRGEPSVPIPDGRVSTFHHPVVVITSNGEREFPEAFRRRCVPLDLKFPAPEILKQIVAQQLGDSVPRELVDEAVAAYTDRPTDALLQEVFLRHVHGIPTMVARPAAQRTEDGRSD